MKIKLLALLLLSSLGFADTTTNRLGLTLPTVGSANWANKVNNNFAILDAATASQSIPNNFQNNIQFSSSVYFTGLGAGNGSCLGISSSSQTVLVPCASGGATNGTIIPSPQFSLGYYSGTGSTSTLSGAVGLTTDGASITLSSITASGVVHFGNYSNTNVSSTTPLAVITRAPYYGAADNSMQAIYGEYNGQITGTTADFNGIRGNFFNTDNANILADANGVEGNAVDVNPGKNGTLNGGQFYVQGRGSAPNYMGIYDRALWTSTPGSGVTTTTGAVTGLFVYVAISSGDYTTPVVSSGPAYSIFINPKLGSGAFGKSWAILSYDSDPSLLVGSLNVNGSLQTGTSYYQFNTALSVVNPVPGTNGYDAVFSTSPLYNNGNAAVTISSNAAIAIESTDNTPLAIYHASHSSTPLQLLDYFDYLGDLQMSTTGAILNLAGNFSQGYGGMDLQNPSSSSNTFTRGMVSSDLVWSNTSGQWFSAGNGGNDYATMLFRQSGDIAFASSANQLPSTNFTDATLKANTHLYINATSGDTGIGMGASVPSTAQLQVVTSTSNTYGMIVSTSIFPTNYVAVSTGSQLSVVGTGGLTVTGTAITSNNTQSTGSFPDPEAITLNGNSSNNTDCIGFHTPADAYGSNPPYEECRSGTTLQIGTKSITGGLAPFIQLNTAAGSFPVGSTVTINTPLILGTVAGAGTQCLHVNNAGTVTGTGSDCGSGGSGGSSALGVNFNGVSVTSPTAQINFVGSGVSVTSTGSTATVTIPGSSSSTYIAGGTGTILITTTTIPNTIDVVSNVFPTLAQLQAGTPNKCNPSSGSGTNYTCNFSPSLSAYSNGMSFSFTPDVASTGPVSVAISGLPQEAVFKSSGTVLANYGDLYPNIPVMLVYNSTLNSGLGGFVIQGPPPTTDVNVKTLGAHGDAQFQTGCSITSGAATLSCSASVFKATDVGKTVTVPSAITSTSTLTTTIAIYTSATSVVLASSATKTVTASTNTICWGTDDGPAINFIIQRNPNAIITVPSGNYLIGNAGSQGLIFNGFTGTFSMGYGSKLVFTRADYIYGTGIQVLNSNNAKFSNVSLYYADESELPMARGSSSGYAFLVNQSTGIQVDGLYIDAAPGVGYWSNTALRSSVSHARVQNTTADGVHLENCGDSTVDDMWTSNTGDDALAFVQAVGELPYGSGCTASNVHVRNSKSRGIAIIGGKDITVTGIDVDGSAAPGVYVAYQNTYTMPVNVSILGGTINRAGILGNGTNNDGLGISSCTNVTASGLSITNSYGNGVNISNTAANIAMSDIIIDTSGLSGFTAQTATDLLLTNIRSAHSQGNGFEFYISSNVNASNLVAYDTSITTTTPLNRAWWSDNAVGPINVNGLTVIDDSTTATGYVIGESASSSKAPMVVSGITTNIKNGGASYLIGDANAQFHLFGNMADLTTANTWGGAQTFSAVGTFNSNVIINNAAGYLAMGNQQNNTSGLNVQSPSVSQTNFTRGNVGSNLVYSVASGSWTTSNNFGLDYAGMLFRPNGDIAFPTSNTTASNTTLTDAQLMATNKLYIKGTTGLMGLGMGATVPSLAQFQVQGTTTTTYETYFSTASGSFHIAISTNGHVISGGPTPVVSTCGSTPNGSVIGDDRSGVISVGGGSVTGCTLTFANSYGTGCLVACTESDTSTAATADISSISPTAVSFGFSATLGGGSIYYNCEGIGSSCK